jgi:hypothetical protein
MGTVAGCIDADAREDSEISSLMDQGVYVLPVAEIENILLLPSVFVELAKALEFSLDASQTRLENLRNAVFDEARRDLEMVAVRYATRRVDAALRKLSLSARKIDELDMKYKSALETINPISLAKFYKDKLESAIVARNFPTVLALYDNKGLLSICARQLGLKGRDDLVEFVGRLLNAPRGSDILLVLKAALPEFSIA